MSEYYSIVTNAGLQKQYNCLKNGQPFDISEIAVGDGLGESYTPNPEQTRLKNEKWRGKVLTSGIADNKLFAAVNLPSSTGGYTIREIGLFDSEGTLLCIGKSPPTVKYLGDNSGLHELFIKFNMLISNSELEKLIVQTDVNMATVDFVNGNFANKDLDNLSKKGQEKFNEKQDVIIAGEGIIKEENTLSASLTYEYLDAQIIPININFSGNISGLSYIEV